MSHPIRLIGHRWKMCLIIKCKAASALRATQQPIWLDFLGDKRHTSTATHTQWAPRLYYLRAYNSNNLVPFASATSQVKLTRRQTWLWDEAGGKFIYHRNPICMQHLSLFCAVSRPSWKCVAVQLSHTRHLLYWIQVSIYLGRLQAAQRREYRCSSIMVIK